MQDKFTLEIMVVKGSKQLPIIFMTRKDAEGSHHCGGTQNLTDNLFNLDSCTGTGETIIFDKRTMRGGVSDLLGSTVAANQRDTLAVMPFSCQSM